MFSQPVKRDKISPSFLVAETLRKTDTAPITFQAGNGNFRLPSIALMSVSPKFPFRSYMEKFWNILLCETEVSYFFGNLKIEFLMSSFFGRIIASLRFMTRHWKTRLGGLGTSAAHASGFITTRLRLFHNAISKFLRREDNAAVS